MKYGSSDFTVFLVDGLRPAAGEGADLHREDGGAAGTLRRPRRYARSDVADRPQQTDDRADRGLLRRSRHTGCTSCSRRCAERHALDDVQLHRREDGLGGDRRLRRELRRGRAARPADAGQRDLPGQRRDRPERRTASSRSRPRRRSGTATPASCATSAPLGAPNGGVVTVQVTALTGIAAITPQLVDSADGVSFAVVTSLTPITTAPSVGEQDRRRRPPLRRLPVHVPRNHGSVTLAASFSPNP